MELLLLFLVAGAVLAVVVGRANRRTVSHAPLQRGVTGWKVVAPGGTPQVRAADVVSLLSRLGSDVRSLDPGQDPVARQAMADASERWTTARDVLDAADSQELLRTAWVAAVEGLSAARVVRARLGLDPGPDVPALPGSRPELAAPADVLVDGQRHHATPAYEPGHAHYFPGADHDGAHVPRGWYDRDPWPDGFRRGEQWS